MACARAHRTLTLLDRRKTDFEAGLHATTPRGGDAGSVSAGLTVY